MSDTVTIPRAEYEALRRHAPPPPAGRIMLDILDSLRDGEAEVGALALDTGRDRKVVRMALLRAWRGGYVRRAKHGRRWRYAIAPAGNERLRGVARPPRVSVVAEASKALAKGDEAIGLAERLGFVCADVMVDAVLEWRRNSGRTT